MSGAKLTLVELALQYAGEGLHVFPAKPDKKPYTEHGFKDATTDPEQIATWWGEHPRAAIGIATGASGLIVVDLDEKDGKHGVAAWEAFVGDDKVGRPMTVHTPTGGQHLIYADSHGEFASTIDRVAFGIDTRGQGGYIIAAGSITEAGKYRLAKGSALRRQRFQPIPKKLRKRLLAATAKKVHVSTANADTASVYETLSAPVRRAVDGYVSSAVTSEIGKLHTLTELKKPDKADYRGPAWDVTVFEVAANLLELSNARWSGIDEAALRSRFDEAAPTDDGWTANDNAAKWESARRKVDGKERPYPALNVRDDDELILDADEDDVLGRVYEYAGRFIAYPSEAAHVAHSIWIAHAHLIECFENTPRLAFLSPEPGSGKSRALEITETLVPNPVITVNSSAAYIFRKIAEDEKPTLLMDEVDAIWSTGKNATNEEIRGVVNSGHRKGAIAGRAAVRGKEVVTEEFPSFCAVALAGLGDLPDTIMTRSIVVRMKRRRSDEKVAPYRQRVFADEAARISAALRSWARSVEYAIRTTFPELPEGIVDRDADVWEPLIAIADAAGGEWPVRARAAATALVSEAHDRPVTLGIRFLSDVRRILGDRDRIRSTDLLGELLALEDGPWATLNGQPIDSRFVGKFLAKYEISSSTTIRFDDGPAKGFHRRQFHDAFERYLPPIVEELNL